MIDMNIIVGAMLTGVIAYIGTTQGVKKTFKNNRAIEQERMNEERFRVRPKFQIDKANFNENEKCIKLFLAPLGCYAKYKGLYLFLYNDKILNEKNYIHYDYILKNVGKGDSSVVNIVVVDRKKLCIMEYKEREYVIKGSYQKYSYMHDKMISPNEALKVRIYAHKEKIPASVTSAALNVFSEDEYGKSWGQPFFFPEAKMYGSSKFPEKDISKLIRGDHIFDIMDSHYYRLTPEDWSAEEVKEYKSYLDSKIKQRIDFWKSIKKESK